MLMSLETTAKGKRWRDKDLAVMEDVSIWLRLSLSTDRRIRLGVVTNRNICCFQRISETIQGTQRHHGHLIVWSLALHIVT